ncbi:MAG: ATP-dependent Clp protease ATP-binding subunit ClpC1 [Arthrobacter sp.]|nr:ATP-dependent Clp protease ATP-binding subunit ClpC1 [Arthrobacter sp.]
MEDELHQRVVGQDEAIRLVSRAIRRTIQREIENQLSEKILFGEIHPGDIVVVDVDGEGDDARFTFTGTTKPRIPDALPASG